MLVCHVQALYGSFSCLSNIWLTLFLYVDHHWHKLFAWVLGIGECEGEYVVLSKRTNGFDGSERGWGRRCGNVTIIQAAARL